MHRIVALYNPPLDPEHFKEYYQTTHLGLAAKLPGLLRMHHGFNLQTMTEGPSWFCTWVGEFENAAAADAALQSPEGADLAADLPNYAAAGVTLFRYDLGG